jgi:hypothetical protein
VALAFCGRVDQLAGSVIEKPQGLHLNTYRSSAKARLISCSSVIGRLQTGQTFLISGVCLSVIALDLACYRSCRILSTTAGSALRKIKQAEISSDRTSPGLASVTLRHVNTIGHRPPHQPSMGRNARPLVDADQCEQAGSRRRCVHARIWRW